MIARQSKREKEEPVIQTSIRLPEKTHTELKIRAAKEGKSFNLLLEEIISEYLKSARKK